MSTEVLHLNELRIGMPGLMPTLGGMLAEAAAVCLAHNGHLGRCDLVVTGHIPKILGCVWPSVTEQQRSSYADLQEATEYGACGIAILTVNRLTGLVVLSRSAKGTGFDYWLATQQQANQELPFQETKRLEVSGVLTGTAAHIETRTRQKIEQVSVSSGAGKAIIAIVEFSAPTARLEIR